MYSGRIKDIRSYQDRISSLQERIVRLRSAMEITARQLTDMPHGNNVRDRLADDMAKLDELERQLVEETISLETAVADAEKAISKLPDAEQKIMRLRYVDGFGWRKVSKTSNYSVQHCFRLHSMALRKLREDESK